MRKLDKNVNDHKLSFGPISSGSVRFKGLDSVRFKGLDSVRSKGPKFGQGLKSNSVKAQVLGSVRSNVC
jgi:hypothetical protein